MQSGWGQGTALWTGILLLQSFVPWGEVKPHLTVYSVKKPKSEVQIQVDESAEGIQESFMVEGLGVHLRWSLKAEQSWWELQYKGGMASASLSFHVLFQKPSPPRD